MAASGRGRFKPLHFSIASDKAVVTGLYERALRAACGGVVELAFPKSGWDGAAAASFAASLAMCGRIRRLNLGQNELGDWGVEALAATIAKGVVPKLKVLQLWRTGMGDAGLAALVGAISAGARKLEVLELRGNKFASAEGMIALARAPFPALKKLELSYNRITNEAVVALADALGARIE